MHVRRSLLDLDDLSATDLHYILNYAERIESSPDTRTLEGVACANLFFEQSTRTFASFNLAQLRLGAHLVNLSPKDLSLATKGETIEDTVITLAAMGFSLLVVRHSEAGFPARVAQAFDGHVINAGDGGRAHPTQALLDLYTLCREFGPLAGRRIAIVGDIAHSRVAHSLIHGIRRLDGEVTLVGPQSFATDDDAADGVLISRDFDAVLTDVDAVVLLRIQHERFDAMPLSMEEYTRDFQLNAQRLAKLATHAIILHPGPYNRGIELDESVLSYAGWRYARQVAAGVPIRMAVLDFLVHGMR